MRPLSGHSLPFRAALQSLGELLGCLSTAYRGPCSYHLSYALLGDLHLTVNGLGVDEHELRGILIVHQVVHPIL